MNGRGAVYLGSTTTPKSVCYSSEDVWALIKECAKRHLASDYVSTPKYSMEPVSYYPPSTQVHPTEINPIEMDPDEAIAILEAAIEVVEKDGWVQRDLRKGGKYCAFGAIKKAAALTLATPEEWDNCLYDPFVVYSAYVSIHPKRQQEILWLTRLLANLIGPGYYAIPKWNDTEGRTVGDVIDLFKRGIKEIENNRAVEINRNES